MPNEKPKCHFCPKEVTEEHLCYGCKVYICEECDLNYNLMGAHEPHRHKEDPLENEK